MHPTMQRLYAALSVLLNTEKVGSTAAAQALGLSSAQMVNNWEARGVSRAGMVKASSQYRIRTAWIERGELPMIESGKAATHHHSTAHHVGEPPSTYLPAAITVQQALDVLERELSALDMAGRERVAPLLESFARSPGAVVKHDIAETLRAGGTKSRAAA
jgi:hypothetical protein